MPQHSEVELKRWLDALRNERMNYERSWQEISDLMQPFRGDITTMSAPGQPRVNWKQRPLFDSTAAQAAETFVNFLKGSLFPSNVDWLSLHSNTPSAQDALDKSAERILRILSDSNFYVAANAYLRDFALLGNGTLYVQHDEQSVTRANPFGGLFFEAVPIARMWWRFSHTGRVNVVARSVEMSATDAEEFFGFLNAGPGTKAGQLLSANRGEEMVGFFHMVFRNPQGEAGTAEKPWHSYWFTDEGPEPEILSTGGFDALPYIASRWLVVDGEQYGRGKGHIARPDAKGVNELRRQLFIALGKELNPPFMAEDGSIVRLDVAPNGFITVRPPEQMRPDYLRSGTDFSLAFEVIQKDHENIRRAFLGDVLQEPDSQPRSAEESRARQVRALARLSSVSETVIHEFLRPLIDSVITILLRENQLPELAEMEGLEIDPRFTSPFFSAQKQSSALRVFAFIERRMAILERTQDPAWVDDLDPDAIREFDRKMSDVPVEIFRDPAEVELRRQARAARAAQERLQGVVPQPPRPASRSATASPSEAQVTAASV